MVTDPFELSFAGKTPSKKNSYRPRKGGGGFFKDTKLQAQLDNLAMQVPYEYRNLKLVNPDVEFRFYLPKDSKHSRCWRSDADNRATALIDVLVQLHVFEDDCFALFNGKKTIFPAELAEDGIERAVLTIIPRTT